MNNTRTQDVIKVDEPQRHKQGCLKRLLRWAVRIVLALVLLVVLLAIASALSNLGLPTRSTVADRLTGAEKARVAELFHLRSELGNDVWTGWGELDLPVLVYNESHAFLIGVDQAPPAGWIAASHDEPRGGPWREVPEDDFFGRPYYRQALAAGKPTPQAFTVCVGNHWAASMTTKQWTEIGLAEEIRDDLPPVLEQIFPYRVVHWFFTTDWYVCALAHESFHAFQATAAAARFQAAESTSGESERRYPWDNPAFRAKWHEELALLQAGVRAATCEQTAVLAREFIAARENRRKASGLGAELIEYERNREWLEGLAKYVELHVWRQAAVAPAYQPIEAIRDDADFADYEHYARRWDHEVGQITRMAGDRGDGRFYYSGMAQAVMLDRLSPEWKQGFFDGGKSLEQLLSQLLSND